MAGKKTRKNEGEREIGGERRRGKREKNGGLFGFPLERSNKL